MRDFIPVTDLQSTSSPFRDANFKLAVLDRLIQNGTLDLGNEYGQEFQDKLSGGRYDYEKDGYELNQAFLNYFYLYPLSADQLAAVEQLSFDGGLYIYGWIYPFWGGETDDFDVKSLSDIKLLPNLIDFGFSAMLTDNDLRPLSRAQKLEVVELGLIGEKWRNWQALLELANLKRLRFYTENYALEAEPVLAELRARGVAINSGAAVRYE